jgi:two-component system, NarL family, nitrate/nitrite response regulator NarL
LTHIVVIGASPLLAAGLAASLAATDGWHVAVQAEAGPAPAQADVLLLHVDTPEVALASAPGVPAVVLTDDARAMGSRPDTRALAVLPPTATPGQLRAAVAAVLQGLSVRDPSMAYQAGWRPGMSALAHATGEHEPLTPRELEVYELIGKGLSNRDIGNLLGISAHTAKYHVGQILAKVGAATRAEAVSAGLRMGIIGL